MLQAVARPGSLAEAHSILASRDGAVIIAGGTVVMPILNYGTDAFDTLVSLRGSGLAGIAIERRQGDDRRDDDAVRSAGERGARLPVAGARHHRLADRAQHGDGRRQSVRQAALWRPRGLPHRARRDGLDFRAARRARASLSRASWPVRARPRRDRHRHHLRAAGGRHVQVPQGDPQGAQFGGDRHGRRGRLGQRRQGRAMPHRPWRRRRLGDPRAVGREGADRQAARPRQRGSGSAPRRATTSRPPTMPMPAPGTGPA